MNRAHFLRRFVALALLSLVSCHAAPPTAPASEKEKIEQLIAKVESLDAKFFRNDSEYDAKSAAKFLRGKWNRDEDKIKTASDFITIVGSKSSTSGKPYMIRFKDGTEKKCGDFLTEELAKFNAPAKKP